MKTAAPEEPEVAPVEYMDGVAGDDVARLFAACDLQTGNYDFSRLTVLGPKDEWLYWDVDFTVVSVAMYIDRASSSRIAYALGRNGQVWEKLTGKEPTITRIKDAGTGKGKYGRLAQVRFIGKDPYICGSNGQVYKRKGGNWVHWDKGILEDSEKEDALELNGIDGTAADDIYVVGDDGKIFHFNGSAWTDVSFPTNFILERVRCIDRDLVYVCGQGGLLLVGSRRGWKVIDHQQEVEDFWDLEHFKGKLWLVADNNLMVLEEDELKPVDTGLSPHFDAHRLTTNGKLLWSVGEKHLASFDGKRWTRVIDPDNVP